MTTIWTKLALSSLLICSALIIAAADERPQEPVAVDIIIGAELHPDSSEMDPEAQWDMEVGSIIEMLNRIDPLGLNVTVCVTGDYVNKIAGNAMYKLYVTSVGSKYNHELAVYGMTSGEELGTMAYGDQYSRLMEAKRLVESAYICGGRTIVAKGLFPQSFSASETTYRILERIGIDYIAVYQPEILNQPGHEDESWPRPMEGYDLYTVPISSSPHEGELAPLSDKYSKEVLGLSGGEWYDLLVAEFEDCREKNEPMVVIFTNVVTGGDEGYMDAFKRFVGFSTSQGARFVSTDELVEMARSGAV
ncbi:MAG: hypothetical protein PHW55_07210 [Methanothrix sp.]|nr:hypothetical protein [Methanothrix sp.]MDD5768354.1 hypothetical protein [Methanothrix sp.]